MKWRRYFCFFRTSYATPLWFSLFRSFQRNCLKWEKKTVFTKKIKICTVFLVFLVFQLFQVLVHLSWGKFVRLMKELENDLLRMDFQLLASLISFVAKNIFKKTSFTFKGKEWNQYCLLLWLLRLRLYWWLLL